MCAFRLGCRAAGVGGAHPSGAGPTASPPSPGLRGALQPKARWPRPGSAGCTHPFAFAISKEQSAFSYVEVEASSSIQLQAEGIAGASGGLWGTAIKTKSIARGSASAVRHVGLGVLRLRIGGGEGKGEGRG